MRSAFRNSWVPSRSFFGDFEPFFDSAFFPLRNWPQVRLDRDSLTSAAERTQFEPFLEAEETNEAFLMRLDLPGVKKEDVKLDVAGRTLTISAERKRESSVMRYERQVGFPATVDMSKLEASLEHGVLTVAVPKMEEEKPRSIEIQDGRSGLISRLLAATPLGSTSVKPTN